MQDTIRMMIAMTFAVGVARAASTWNVGDGSWSNVANWDTPPVSDPATELVFDGAGGAVVNDAANPFALKSLTFGANAGPYLLSGGALTLNGNLVNDSGETQTIINDMTLNGDSTWRTSGNLRHSGVLDGSNASFGKDGSGELLLTQQGTWRARNGLLISGTLRISGPQANYTHFNGGNLFPWWDVPHPGALILEKGATFQVNNGIGGGNDGTIVITDAGTCVDMGNSSFTVGYRNNFVLRNDAVITNASGVFFNEQGLGKVYAMTNGVHVEASVFGVSGFDKKVMLGGAGRPSRLDVGKNWGFLAISAYGAEATDTAFIVSTDGLVTNLSSTSVGNFGNNAQLIIEKGGVFDAQGNINIAGDESHANNSLLWVDGRHPHDGTPSLFNANGRELYIQSDNSPASAAPGAESTYTNSTLMVSNGGVFTNATILAGSWHHQRAGKYEHSRVIVRDGGQLHARIFRLGEQSSGNLALIEGHDSLLNLMNDVLYIGNGRYARGNRMIIDAGCVTNVANFYLGYQHGSSTHVYDNSLVLTNGASLTTRGDCFIGADSWWSGAATQTNSANFAIVSGANSIWNHTGGDVMRLGFVNGNTNAAYANWVKVEKGGLLRYTPGIEVGQNKPASFDNRLILGLGGCVETPYVRVGDNGAVSNAIVFAGGAITGDTLTVNTQNGFIVEATAHDFVPSTFRRVTLAEGTWITPVAIGTGIGNRTYELIRADNIDGFENLTLDPSVNPRLWKLHTSATAISLTKFKEPTTFMLR